MAIENANLLRALQETDRAKDVFLATLAHELRNPLAPVWNGLSIIKRVPDDAARVQQVADMIERQVGQLARLVDDLLDVSRITTGKIELKKQPTDLASILRSAIETSRPHIEAARHKLSVQLPDEPIELEADPVRLAQVFSNLLNNAAKYTRPGGNIDVDRAGRAASGWSVRVRDNGAGIAPEMLGKVFGLFTQVTHPSERTPGRHGHRAVAGGRAGAPARRQRRGPTAKGWTRAASSSSCLPRLRPAARKQPQPPGAPQAANAEPAAGRRRRILVVDDNRTPRTRWPNCCRYSAARFPSRMTACRRWSGWSSSRRMSCCWTSACPTSTATRSARRIRGLEGVPQPRLIALTGWGQEQDKKLAAQAGFDDHWTKPVDSERLQQLAA